MIEPILEADRLLLYGLLDRAEALYRSVADTDPDNGFAFVGLARVAAERGDNEGAHRFSAEAARIDPGNAVAQALAARTAELLAARDTAVETPRRAGRGGIVRRVLHRE